MEQSVRETAGPGWKRATQYLKVLPWEDSEEILRKIFNSMLKTDAPLKNYLKYMSAVFLYLIFCLNSYREIISVQLQILNVILPSHEKAGNAVLSICVLIDNQ